jgi:hypothetical protein
MLRALVATREAQESENRRRLAWERELEAKYQQRQAETESQLAEMKRQITYLKACVASLLHHGREGTAHVASGSGYLLDEPDSLSLAAPPGAGSTTSPPLVSPGNVISERSQSHGVLVDALSRSVSPCPSNRKRPSPSQNHERSDSDDSGSESSVSSTEKRPPKRVNNRDKTCYTIQVFHTTHSEMSAYFSQTAMRRHIYHALGVSPEDELPPSHCEGLPLGDNEPVRFVWEKTTKQSRHNALMKERVLADLKANRKLYGHVPEADFALKTLSTAFDQAFATFRQKYRIQRDPSVSFTVRNREEQKSMKSRRLHRKKVVRILLVTSADFISTSFSRSENNATVCGKGLRLLLMRHSMAPWSLIACHLRNRMMNQNKALRKKGHLSCEDYPGGVTDCSSFTLFSMRTSV